MNRLSLNVMRIPAFRVLLCSRICVLMALQAQAVIVGWQVYSITKSPLMLGLTGLAEAVPAIACAFFAGHFVDTANPRKIYILALGALLLNTIALFYFAGGFSGLGDQGILIAIFSGIIFSGFARSFIIPSAFALLPMIVKREEFAEANSWQTAGHQITFILGPTIGGLLFGAYGGDIAWLFVVIMMVLAVSSALLLRLKQEPVRAEKRPAALQSIKEGWVFLLENRTLLSVMALDMLAVLFGGAIAMLPAFADQVLFVGAEGLGLLRAAPAIGAIITALYFAVMPMRRITSMRLLIVVAGFGLSMIGFGASTSFALSLLFLALSGAFDSVSMVIRSTLTQILTPDHMKGRVSSVNSMFVISSNELGALQSGLAATVFGLVPSVILGGSATLVVVALTAALSKSFRRLNIET